MKKASAPKASKAAQSKLALAPKFSTESKAHHAAKAEFGETYESAVTFVAVVHKGKLTGEWQYLANASAVPASAGDRPLPKATAPKASKAPPLPKGLAATPVAVAILRKSTAKSPVHAVWELCEQMVPCARRELVSAAEAAGIATNTARTQWAAWHRAQREAKAAKPATLGK